MNRMMEKSEETRLLCVAYCQERGPSIVGISVALVQEVGEHMELGCHWQKAGPSQAGVSAVPMWPVGVLVGWTPDPLLSDPPQWSAG